MTSQYGHFTPPTFHAFPKFRQEEGGRERRQQQRRSSCIVQGYVLLASPPILCILLDNIFFPMSSSSLSEREQFLVSASMRPTLMADPLDGQETEMTDGFRFIRKHIEFFAAGAADVENRRKKGGKKSEIRVGQIGTRCVHCAHVPPKERANGTVAFPTNLSLVYQSVRNWQSKLSS